MSEMELRLLDESGNEVNYVGYERVRAPRDWWTELPSAHQRWWCNFREIRFPQCEGGAASVSCIGVHDGDGLEKTRFQLTNAPIYLSCGATLLFAPGQLTISVAAECVTDLDAFERDILDYLLGTSAPKPQAVECSTCHGDWSLLRDPCPGCGMVRAAR